MLRVLLTVVLGVLACRGESTAHSNDGNGGILGKGPADGMGGEAGGATAGSGGGGGVGGAEAIAFLSSWVEDGDQSYPPDLYLAAGATVCRVAERSVLAHAWNRTGDELAYLHGRFLEIVSVPDGARWTVSDVGSMDFLAYAPTRDVIALAGSVGRVLTLRVLEPSGADVFSAKLSGGPTGVFWSPDGEIVAVRSGRSVELYDAAGARVDVTLPGLTRFLGWSRNGDLVFLREDGVARMSVAGGEPVAMPGVPVDTNELVWSPVADATLFTSLYEIGVVLADGSAPWRVRRAFTPAWSHDGRQVAYGGHRLHVVDASTWEATEVPNADDRYDTDPRWAPRRFSAEEIRNLCADP